MLTAEDGQRVDDVDSRIAESNSFADGIRAELPERAQRVCEAIARFAAPFWELETRRVIEQNPEKAIEKLDRFPQLKAEVRRLQADALGIVHRHYAETFTTATIDRRVTEILGGPRNERDQMLEVAGLARVWEEPLRYVLGEIGEPLAQAELTFSSAMSLDPTCAVDPNGRYRYPIAASEELSAAVAAYDEKLRELALALTDVESLKREKLRQRAIGVWESTL